MPKKFNKFVKDSLFDDDFLLEDAEIYNQPVTSKFVGKTAYHKAESTARTKLIAKVPLFKYSDMSNGKKSKRSKAVQKKPVVRRKVIPKPATRIGNIPQLHGAVREGNAERVKILLSREENYTSGEEGSSINAGPAILISQRDPEDDGNTPLHVVSMDDRIDIAAILLEYGAKIGAKNKLGDTCLHIAASYGQVDMLKFFLARNVKVELPGQHEFSPLHSAAKSGQAIVIKYLMLETTSNIEARSAIGDTPLHVAAYSGEIDAIKMLLRYGAELEARNKVFETPLHRACAYGAVSAARLLFLRKGNLAARQKYGWTLLHSAASNGHNDVIRFLLEFRADINAQDFNGNTPLHAACFFGKYETIRFLLSKGAQIEIRDSQGRTPLHAAAWSGKRPKNIDNSHLPIWYGFARSGAAACSAWQTKLNKVGYFIPDTFPSNYEAVKILLEAKADVLAKDVHNHTAVMFSCCTGQIDSLRLIMKSGARLDERSMGGRTLLHHIAAGCGDLDVANLLLERNIPLQTRDRNSDTALLLAARLGKVEFAQQLIKRGANPNKLNRHYLGSSPLHQAAENGHIDVAKMLLSMSNDGKRMVDINSLNADGDTALVTGARLGDHGIVWLLLSSGASASIRRSSYNNTETAVHAASREGHLNVIRLFLDRKFDPLTLDGRDQTILHAAASGGHSEICRLLITDYNIHPNSPDCLGRQPIHLAAMHSHVETVRMFLQEFRIDVEAKDHAGDTPLHHACDRQILDENDAKLISLFKDESLTNVSLAQLMKNKNNEGTTPYMLLKNISRHSSSYDEVFHLILKTAI